MKKIYVSSQFKNVDNFMAFTLKRDLANMGYDVVNKETDEIMYGDSKMSPEYGISKADFFIAIIKDKSPIVFYELGYATALGKKVLIISESEYDLPLALSKYNHMRFDSGIYNSIYGVINFIESAKIDEESQKGGVMNFEDFVSSIQKNSQVIDRVSGLEFENFVFAYFEKKGARIERSSSSSDYGYDFVLTDWNGHQKTIVEVKKYNKNSKVSVNTIQQVIGAMNIYESDHAIIITTSEFTASAKEFATSLTKDIELWDINYLTENLALKQ